MHKITITIPSVNELKNKLATTTSIATEYMATRAKNVALEAKEVKIAFMEGYKTAKKENERRKKQLKEKMIIEKWEKETLVFPSCLNRHKKG